MTAAVWLLALGALCASGPSLDTVGVLAGDYCRGDGDSRTETLSLRPDATYSFTAGGHLGRSVDVEGRFSLDGSFLVLEPAGPPTRSAALTLPSKLVVVRWATRLYLIPEEEGAQFAASVSRGWEPRSGMFGWFLLRQPDWERPAQGLPNLPAQWQKWLLPAPIEARITRTLARHRAEIDVGSKHMIEPGLVLTLVSEKHGSTGVRVLSVTANSSIIENDYGDPPLLIGLRVTSRAQ